MTITANLIRAGPIEINHPTTDERIILLMILLVVTLNIYFKYLFKKNKNVESKL